MSAFVRIHCFVIQKTYQTFLFKSQNEDQIQLSYFIFIMQDFFFLIRNDIKKKNYFCILKTYFQLFLIQYYLSVPR